jgi:ABC-type sugar transport system ATPase subunit
MLEVKNISKNFGGVQALKNVSVQFFNGEIHGLVGGNGAGKSP